MAEAPIDLARHAGAIDLVIRGMQSPGQKMAALLMTFTALPEHEKEPFVAALITAFVVDRTKEAP